MDRQIVYPGAIPLDTDILNLERNALIAQGFIARAAFGTGTQVWGLSCGPTSPASLSVQIGPGAIVFNTTLDQNAFGSLAADTADALVKVGINLTSTTLTTTAPSSSGQSINYLVEASFLEEDTTPVVLPYYNASNPAQPYTGPSNSGAPQNTQRIERVQLQLKAGTPANTGTQTTPAVDSGWVGLYVVTVAFEQTTVTSGNISVYPTAPFILNTLSLIPSGMEIFLTSSTTFTVPPGVYRLTSVEVWGGGGGGGGATTSFPGSGGGGGGYAKSTGVAVTPGQQLTVTIGAGGTAGTSTANGGTGGTTSISGTGFTTLSATGGAGGGSASGDAVGGSGGVGSGGNTKNVTGGCGNACSPSAGSVGGAGGAAQDGGCAGAASTGTPGAATSPGGGGAGSGSGTPGNGGVGMNGAVSVQY